jgi:uncharacterized protein
MRLTELSPPFAAMLPFTRYYEFDSAHVGARFGVWVTVPAMYLAQPERRFPAIYLSDGAQAVPQTAGAQLLHLDPINPILPFVHVGVGYVGADALRQLAVRARDLLPPGEPILPGVSEQSLQRLVDVGILDSVGVKLYLQNLEHPAADRFLAFLTQELHPCLSQHYRIEVETAGLYGYSYGGLFSIYTALLRSPLFHRIGAGSPGIQSPTSTVFAQYRAERAREADHSNRMLHITVCEREMSVASYYQQLVGQGTAQLLSLAQQLPLKGLQLSSQIIAHESHQSGLVPSWYSFLRTCYAAKA